MGLKRRDLLALLGLAGLSGAIVGKLFNKGNVQSQTTASSPVSAIAPKAAASRDPLLRFVAVADTGAGDRNQYAVADAMAHYHAQKPYNLVVLAGDNIYTNGEISKIAAVFEQPYADLLKQNVKFRACLGNHDIRTDNGDPQVQYANFNMQGRYYTFREQSVQFFAIDTNVNADWKAQLTWLEQELKRSDAPWKIVFGHHPIYSSGVYGSDKSLIAELAPLFQKYRVQLYMNGHEHSYERTQPIQGTTYLVTGIGGAALRPVDRSQWTAFSTSQYGFSAIEVYADRLEIQGIGTDNQRFDRGVIPLQSA